MTAAPWSTAGYHPPELAPAPRKITTPGQVVRWVEAPATDGDLAVRADLAGYADSILRTRVRGFTGTTVVQRSTVETERTAITGLSLLVQQVVVIGQSDGITPTDSTAERPSLVEDTELRGPGERIGYRHNDGIQLWQGGHFTLRRALVHGWTTSCLMLKTDEGPIDNVLVEDTELWNPGRPVLYVRQGKRAHGRPTNVTVRRTVLGGTLAVDQSFTDRTPIVSREELRLEPWWIVAEDCTNPDGSPWVPARGWHVP